MQSCIHCGIHYTIPPQGKISDSTCTKSFTYQDYEELGHQFTSFKADGLEEVVVEGTVYPVEQLTLVLENHREVEFIQNGQMVSYLQPIISLQNASIFGFESLLRSAEPNYSIHPGKLFSLANNLGLHSRLDQRAREAAIKAKADVIPKGIKSFINFLPSTIYNPEFCLKHTFSLVEKYEIDPADLVFEVVETEKIVDMPHLLRVLKRYKQEGMKVALDDVGAGFASIDVLSSLEPDFVKIDRGYVSNCNQDESKQQFLERVKNLSHDLGFIALAEGIETSEEFQFCRDIGIDLGQGYYIQKPEPPSFFKTYTY